MLPLLDFMEKIMKLWAKISSLLTLGILIYGLYVTFQLFALPADVSAQMKVTIALMPYILLLGVLYYSPLFYYGWVKNPKSITWKWAAKVVAITYTISILVGLISVFDILTISLTPFVLAPIVPLYYYGWRD